MALTGGNLNQAISGEKTNFGREGANFLRKYALPRTFYTSLGVDRLAWDTLQRMWDPDAGGAFAASSSAPARTPTPSSGGAPARPNRCVHQTSRPLLGRQVRTS